MSDRAPVQREGGAAEAAELAPAANATSAPATVPAAPTWFQRLSSILFIVFCMELGLVLLIYPWISTWEHNFFAWGALPASLQKGWNSTWNNPYLRGAVSGLGVLNFWIALTEFFRLVARR